MIKCENRCPESKFDGCCCECPDREDCQSICTDTPDKCGFSITEEDNSATLATFQAEQMAVIQRIADLVTEKKRVEDLEKKMKAQLLQAMEAYGLKKFENDVLSITYVAATTSTSIDSAKLKKKYPAIAEECSKTSTKAAYVKISVKGDDDAV